MKLSTIFNNLARELEVQIANSIISIMEDNKWTWIEFDSEFDVQMCFYPDKIITGIIKINDIYYITIRDESQIDQSNIELKDHGMVPLPDLLSILEEIEKHEIVETKQPNYA